MFMNRVLIANRGEIAVRIIRATKASGLESVSIYSTQDKDSLHVKYADYAKNIGSGGLQENYLNMEKILEVARKFEADAIHPGYGFLAENSLFASKVLDAGFTWIGPPVKTIEILADKLKSRLVAEKVGIPLTPGKNVLINSNEEARNVAKEVGYPLIIKATSGGGGIGIEVVREASELLSAIKRTTRQAKSVFGKGDVIIEKFIEKSRHIEFQFAADKSGNVIHIGERECSIQRRHQKLIEEAPSTAISPEERDRVGELVKKLAQRVKYSNVGTAEFLYKDGKFYFNEVNTRIQVEHPITEEITGCDLVCEQLNIAQGKKLSWKQEDIKFNGHAIEVRVNSEDPLKNFAPAVGQIKSLFVPGGPGIRFDSHIYAGYTVPRDYDSLLGKLIISGENRIQAIKRAFIAISELTIVGVPTNLPFHRVAIANKNFYNGNLNTDFIAENKIIQYIKVAFARRVAALFMSHVHTQKTFLPERKEENWRRESLRESTGRW